MRSARVVGTEGWDNWNALSDTSTRSMREFLSEGMLSTPGLTLLLLRLVCWSSAIACEMGAPDTRFRIDRSRQLPGEPILVRHSPPTGASTP